jgi:hypothetical protein
MRRGRDRRYEAAWHLVLALGSRFEALQTVLDAVFDALVVAGLEVQAVVIAARMSRSGRQRPMRLKKSRLKYGSWPWR